MKMITKVLTAMIVTPIIIAKIFPEAGSICAPLFLIAICVALFYLLMRGRFSKPLKQMWEEGNRVD